MLHDQELEVPTESTSATNILNLNDDCLRAIFSLECFSIFDLCSVVETHSRFKEIVDGAFPKQFKTFRVSLPRLSSNDLEMENTKRILMNFGPFISELTISDQVRKDFSKCRKEFEVLLDWLTAYCINPLETLNLYNVEITEDHTMRLKPFFDTLQKIFLEECYVYSGKTLFAGCESLLELILGGVEFNDKDLAFQNTFPKLVRLECRQWVTDRSVFNDSNCSDIFSRHKHIKALRFRLSNGISHLLPKVADNCKQLAELNIEIERDENDADFKKALDSILTLEHLNKLKISTDRYRNMTKFVEGLSDLKSLEFLSLLRVKGDSEFIPALSKLTRLEELELWFCTGLGNLNPLADLERLTKLTINSRFTDLDLLRMIKRLTNLKTLHLFDPNFEMDKQLYLRIVEIVRARPGRFQYALHIRGCTAKEDSANLFTDKLVRVARSTYSRL